MSNIQIAITDPEYKQWIGNIEKRFRQQQIKAAVQVNSSKIEFYWSLGRDICDYRDLILKALEEHGTLSRPEIDALLMNKLPDILNDQQKKSKIGNLLTFLRKNSKIEVGSNKKWQLAN